MSKGRLAAPATCCCRKEDLNNEDQWSVMRCWSGYIQDVVCNRGFVIGWVEGIYIQTQSINHKRKVGQASIHWVGVYPFSITEAVSVEGTLIHCPEYGSCCVRDIRSLSEDRIHWIGGCLLFITGVVSVGLRNVRAWSLASILRIE